MNFVFNNNKPIYLQIAKIIEDGILKGYLKEKSMIPSTVEISNTHKINPATVAKGYNLLVNENIIYKKRGIGMFVTTGSKNIIYSKRKKEFQKNFIRKMFIEAKKLNIPKEEIIKMVSEFPEEKEIIGL